METSDKKYCYEYPRPSLTSDSVVFGFDGTELKILLVERRGEPFKGMWALPGGFMRMEESIEECAQRELREETNVRDIYLEQFEVFSRPDRDPRGRVVTVAFIALVRPADYEVIGGDDAARAAWFGIGMLPPLAFDHQEIIDKARERLKEILRVRPVAFRLLDRIFSVDDLRKVYEAVNCTVYDRRNFQRKLLQSDIVEEATQADCEGTPAECCCCESAPETDYDRCASTREDNTAKPSARRNRAFKLKNWFEKKKDDGTRTDEGSIKDLFNF